MSERVFKFTKRRLEAEREAMLGAGERQRVVWHTEVTGFGVRLTRAGGLAFLDYRDRTKSKRRLAIGTVLKLDKNSGKLAPGELTVERAREIAASKKVDVRSGGDPLRELQAAAEAALKVESGLTVGQAIDGWIDRRGADWSPVTAAEYRRMLAKDILPQIGHLPLAQLDRQTIMQQISRVATRSRTSASALFRTVSSFVTYLDDEGLTQGLTLPRARKVAKPPTPRSRMPDNEQLIEIWEACQRLTPKSRALARIIILTAQRRASVEGMRWDELNLDEGRWTIPAERMKGRREHQVALGLLAVAELSGLRRTGRYVFSDGKAPPSRVNRILKSLHGWAGGGWSWHDFRRAFMTWAVQNGHPREFAKIALSHLIKDRLDQAYDQHNYWREAAGVMLSWQNHVMEVLKQKSTSNLSNYRRMVKVSGGRS
jgi:integrase